MTWEPSDEFRRWKGCLWCERYHGGGSCEAYSKGIPLALASGESDHMIKRPGDGGLFYKESSEQRDLITGELV